MRLSARNQIKGKILDIKKGATTAHVRVEIAPGQVITSSITNEAVEDLALRAGIEATVGIKASDVMIAVEESCAAPLLSLRRSSPFLLWRKNLSAATRSSGPLTANA